MEYDPDGVEEVPRDEFPPEMPLKAGEIVTATDEEGDDVDLHFEVTVHCEGDGHGHDDGH